ncbi:predicted protein [Naegleria gruberi]|uniref:Predicted protein n=1 Tax=Naegleria gruberi TaxID=5762 RepID=D2VZC9_NAEGR|nr:uncharacterized protein NAEGRDRAFT_81813 [Naegleria gruberi]EFC37825.1 predicted protein [Naegleria gruberi]|eukprot:XP_002670569.1 predicted protein [Naegleria gruberi strain NEG-M]
MKTERRVLIYGCSGSGKTTILNNLTGENFNTDDSAVGVTFQMTIIPPINKQGTEINGKIYRFDDTVGLNECESGTVDNFTAFVKLKDFLKDSLTGFNLFIYVFEKGRITSSDVKNVQLFSQILGQNKVPTLMVVSKADTDNGLKSLDDLTNNTWIKQNESQLASAFGEQTFCAKQTVAFPQPSFTSNNESINLLCNTSRKLLFDLIDQHASDESIFIVTKENFMTVLTRVLNWFYINTKKTFASIGNAIAGIFGHKDVFNVRDELEEKLENVTQALMINFGVSKEKAQEVAKDILGF